MTGKGQWPETTLAARERFERGLGHALADHPIASRSAGDMLQAANRYIEIRARALGRRRAAESRYALMRRCASPLESHFAGRVGDGEAELRCVFAGRGNLRESMAHLWLFVCRLLFEDLAGPDRLADGLKLAADAGYDIQLLRSMLDQALRRKSEISRHQSIRLASLDPYEDFGKMLWHPLRRQQENSRQACPTDAEEMIWSLQSRSDFVAEGGRFDSRERKLMNPLGNDLVPWMDPRRQWRPNPADAFVRASNAAAMPLATGLSGVTMQYLQFARILRMSSLLRVRVAVLGYLMSIKAHSFHEIMTTARYFGCPYAGRLEYHDLPPLKADELSILGLDLPPGVDVNAGATTAAAIGALADGR